MILNFLKRGETMEGRVPLSIYLPVSLKKKLKEIAEKENLTMTDLIIKWIETNGDVQSKKE